MAASHSTDNLGVFCKVRISHLKYFGYSEHIYKAHQGKQFLDTGVKLLYGFKSVILSLIWLKIGVLVTLHESDGGKSSLNEYFLKM